MSDPAADSHDAIAADHRFDVTYQLTGMGSDQRAHFGGICRIVKADLLRDGCRTNGQGQRTDTKVGSAQL